MKKPVKLIGLILILIVAMLLSGCGGPAKTYENAQKALVNGEYEKAAELFESISTYEDSSKLAMYSRALLYGEQEDYAKAIETLGFLGDFKDSAQLKEYYGICELAGSTEIENVLLAAELFDAISAFRDSAARAEKCRQIAYDEAASQFNDGEYESAQRIYGQLKSYKDSEEQVQLCISSIKERENADAYAKAEKLLTEGKYDDAADAFKALGDYKDSSKRIEDAIEAKNADAYAKAEALLESGDYDTAISAFKDLGNYSNSSERVEEAIAAKNEDAYNHAGVLFSEGKYYDAYSAYIELGDYLDSSTLAQESKARGDEEAYFKALDLISSESYEDAIAILKTIPNYQNSSEALAEATLLLDRETSYQRGRAMLADVSFPTNKDMEVARDLFLSLDGYKDSDEILQHFKRVKLSSIFELNSSNSELEVLYYNAWGDKIGKYTYASINSQEAWYIDNAMDNPYWDKDDLEDLTFDENGNLILEDYFWAQYSYEYDFNGHVLSRSNGTYWEYNDDGQLVRYCNPDGTEETTYEYDSTGRVIHEYYLDNKRTTAVFHCYDIYYTYDDSAHEVTERWQYKNDELHGNTTESHTYTLDDEGNIIIPYERDIEYGYIWAPNIMQNS